MFLRRYLVMHVPAKNVGKYGAGETIDYRRFTRRGAERKRDQLMGWSLRTGWWYVYHLGGPAQ